MAESRWGTTPNKRNSITLLKSYVISKNIAKREALKVIDNERLSNIEKVAEINKLFDSVRIKYNTDNAKTEIIGQYPKKFNELGIF